MGHLREEQTRGVPGSRKGKVGRPVTSWDSPCAELEEPSPSKRLGVLFSRRGGSHRSNRYVGSMNN